MKGKWHFGATFIGNEGKKLLDAFIWWTYQFLIHRIFWCFVIEWVQMFLKKDKIQRLVGYRPNKKDISKIIQENRQKRELTLWSIWMVCKFTICRPIRDGPFNLRGGGGVGLWFFVSFRIFFSHNTSVRIFIFFVAQSANFFSRIQQ